MTSIFFSRRIHAICTGSDTLSVEPAVFSSNTLKAVPLGEMFTATSYGGYEGRCTQILNDGTNSQGMWYCYASMSLVNHATGTIEMRLVYPAGDLDNSNIAMKIQLDGDSGTNACTMLDVNDTPFEIGGQPLNAGIACTLLSSKSSIGPSP